MLLSSNGFSQDFAGCRASCDAAGDTCATFMYIYPGSDNCYKWAEGSQGTWGAGGVGDWIAFDKCSGSESLRTADSDCSVCGEGRYQGSPGSSTCEGCGAGRYHEAADGDELRTSNEDCTACEAGQYQASTASTSCNPCSAGSYRAEEGGNAAEQCIAWSGLLPAISHGSCRLAIRSV